MGHFVGSIRATSIFGGQGCPLGQQWLPRRENIRRRLFRSSDAVPKVLRTPGIPGLWCRASAAGT